MRVRSRCKPMRDEPPKCFSAQEKSFYRGLCVASSKVTFSRANTQYIFLCVDTNEGHLLCIGYLWRTEIVCNLCACQSLIAIIYVQKVMQMRCSKTIALLHIFFSDKSVRFAIFACTTNYVLLFLRTMHENNNITQWTVLSLSLSLSLFLAPFLSRLV